MSLFFPCHHFKPSRSTLGKTSTFAPTATKRELGRINLNRRKPRFALLLVLLSLFWAFPASAGPVILGGDDLTSHGSVVAGVNQQGWLYIQQAVNNILNPTTNITRPGNNGRIAALGSAASSATSGNAGAAIGSAAAVLGRSVDYYDGAAAINQFFADLASGAVNPAMLWLAGDGAANDLDSTEGAALTANASAIATFVNSGGGLMAHGSGVTAYGWLPVLIPGLTDAGGCTIAGATLTPAGQAAFPGLTASDISGGPCHSTFQGNLGPLQVLALDGASPGRNFIIGGGVGTTFLPPAPAGPAAPIPTLGEWGLITTSSVLAILGMLAFRKRNSMYR